jgi:hypothetical protein
MPEIYQIYKSLYIGTLGIIPLGESESLWILLKTKSEIEMNTGVFLHSLHLTNFWLVYTHFILLISTATSALTRSNHN